MVQYDLGNNFASEEMPAMELLFIPLLNQVEYYALSSGIAVGNSGNADIA
jgi:hypothetical protein